MWQILTLDLVSGAQYLRDSNVWIKVNNGILMKICWPEMSAHAHIRHFFGYYQEITTKISSSHSRLIFRRRLIASTVCVHKNFCQRLKNELLHSTPHKMKMGCGRSRVRSSGPGTFFRGDCSWNYFYGYYFPGADSNREVVNYWRKDVHLVLVNA